MLRLRPFRTPDAKSIITWTSEPEEFYKWSAGIMGDYPVSEKRLLDKKTLSKIRMKNYNGKKLIR